MADDADRVRQRLTGLAAPALGENAIDVQRGDACFDGYINPWITLLNEFSQGQTAQCPFVDCVSAYLQESVPGPLAFVESWRTIADVPILYAAEGMTRLARFQAINSFRNKLAHVPIPHRVLETLHRGLRTEILALLSPHPPLNARDPHMIEWHAPLSGRIHTFGLVLAGANEVAELPMSPSPTPMDDVHVEPKVSEGAHWSASPFVHVDEELKVSMLMLLNGLREDPTSERFDGQFHRFAAEFRPIQAVNLPARKVAQLIPRSRGVLPESSIETASGRQPVQTNEQSKTASGEGIPRDIRNAADEAFRLRDFSLALELYERLASSGDAGTYNDVARSKHGGALWRVAEREGGSDRKARIERAIELLRQAAAHRDPGYKARSLYEQSKALWHLWRGDQADIVLLEKARSVAGDAARTDNDPAFISWHDRVSSDLEGATEARQSS